MERNLQLNKGADAYINGAAPLSLYLNKIICGDCLEIMRGWPDKCVDLCFADPPFNTGGKIGWYNRRYTDKQCNDNLSKDDYILFCKDWFGEARRISKRLIITPGCGNIGYYPNPIWPIIINKPSSPSFNRFGGFNCYEPLFVYDKPFHRIPRDVITFDSLNFIKDGREEHPCPDNHNMLLWAVETWSQKDDLILDPFCGSGTTCVAAKMLSRKYIGIDISSAYCKIAEERLKAVDTGVPVKEARAGQKGLFE